eukprot:9317565-Ditylum_brightwellii.AAC.1
MTRQRCLAATAHSQKKSIVNPSTIISSGNHNWGCDKIIPSGTGEFNIGENVGDSLFSNGADGRSY